ncbi:hypothetical protein OIU78_002183 [Salix suchowensis]|nr:hypothetical protein OIU78_002183 [Salix suchowensis]
MLCFEPKTEEARALLILSSFPPTGVRYFCLFLDFTSCGRVAGFLRVINLCSFRALMDVKEGVRGEILMSEKRAAHGGDVLIAISSEETSNANVDTKILKGPASKDPENLTPRQSRPNSPFRESSNGGVARSVPFSSPSPEISRSGQTQRKPPKIPNPNDNLTRRRSLTRSVYSKPKSRFGEQPYAINSTVLEENGFNFARTDCHGFSSKEFTY